MSTTQVAQGLYVWTVTLESGEVRTSLGSSLAAVTGNLPVVSAVRGPAFALPTAPPVISSLSPATAALGAPNFTLHVLGTGFQEGAQILWNGAPEPTTRVSATELTTDVNMATAVVAMPIPVSVRSLLGQESNTKTFTLTATE